MGDKINAAVRVTDRTGSFSVEISMPSANLQNLSRQNGNKGKVGVGDGMLLMPPANGLEAAVQIVDAGEVHGVRLRMLGGLAFKLLCPSSKNKYSRDNKDIDLIGRREDAGKIPKIMGPLGYKPREVFNKLNMGERLIYLDMANNRRVDFFLDEFTMCHKFNFKKHILPDSYTLPITQLVMTKLQVVEKTEKEYLDLLAAFRDFGVNGKDGIRGGEIAEICSKDWGICTTFTKSLDALLARTENLSSEDRGIVAPRIQEVKRMITDRPKSLAWRLRARIGENVKWYYLPDEDHDEFL